MITTQRKQIENGEPLLPKGAPNVPPYFEYLKDHEKVLDGLQTFINWWKSFVDRKVINFSYATWIRPVVQYWEKMIVVLKTPQCVDQEKASHDFWPRS